MEFLLPLGIILGLLFTSAFFSGGELAMMALDRINIETEIRRGSKLAKLQRHLRSRPQRFLSTILIGYNVANVTLVTFAAGLAHKSLSARLGEERALLASAVLMTVLITVFAELMPKTVAAISTRSVASWVTYPLYVIDWLLTPVNWAIEKFVTPPIYLLTGGRSKAHHGIGMEEVRTAIAMAHAGGGLRSSDVALAGEALRFSQKDLADAMTPRVDVVAVPSTISVGDALTLMIDTGFTRLPVFGEDLDQILGVILLKDLVRVSLRAARGGRDPEDKWAAMAASPYLREVAHYPSTKSIIEMLGEMQRERVQLVVVVDEHGGTEGIVTLEDILEELVGDIRDETDAVQSADIVRRTEEYVIVAGRARLDQLPELAKQELLEAEASTVGGLMMERLGRPAVVGDEVIVGRVKLTALKVLRNRIKLLRVEPLRKTDVYRGRDA